VNLATGKVTKINDYFSKMTGYTLSNTVRLSPPARSTIEKRYLHKNSAFFWAETTVSLINVPGESAKYCICFLKDISDRKQAEKPCYLISILLKMLETEFFG